MSINWLSDAEPAPAILVLPPAAVSLDEAHAAIEMWEFYSRKRLDPSQRLTVEVMMAETEDGRWAARTTGREMPRQNGKGDELEVVELWGLVQRGEAILHSAHELITVSSAHQRMVGVLQHKDLRRKVGKILNGIGQQMIEMVDGAVILYRTRTNGGGRGLDDISRLVVDEAQHAKPEQLASATPILLANPNPQINFAGTGAIDGVSDWWWSIRLRALGGDPGDFGYVGHTAERVSVDTDGRVRQEPVDVADRSLWPAPNPALAHGRAEIEFFEEQLRILGRDLFAREHLGVWDPPPALSGGVIPSASWRACEDERSGPVGAVAFALDVSPLRDSYAVGVAGSSGVGGDHVEVVAHGPHPGVEVIVAELRRLQDRHGGVVAVVKGSPASSLVENLESGGVRLHLVEGQEYVQACGDFYDAVVAGEVKHLGQDELDAAVSGGERKWSGDAWYWARRTSSQDITPLVSVTAARWAHLHVREAALSVW